ncbi:MAG: hypothetical protein IJR82_04140 [Bacilli bacterium]|nr:hypothetical protein [Bacilli bacterium]
MQELNKQELMDIKGGTNWLSGSLIGAIARAGEAILDAGRSLGTAIRRIFSGNVCGF